MLENKFEDNWFNDSLRCGWRIFAHNKLSINCSRIAERVFRTFCLSSRQSASFDRPFALELAGNFHSGHRKNTVKRQCITLPFLFLRN